VQDFSGADHGFTAEDARTARHVAGATIRKPTMKHITKDQFVAVLNAAGITDEQKHRLHAAFEARHPPAHEAFLQWLGIPPAEIRAIRENSRKT
jgi:hypothetical protein